MDDTVDALCVFFFLKCVFGDVGVMLRFNCYCEPRSKEKKSQYSFSIYLLLIMHRIPAEQLPTK